MTDSTTTSFGGFAVGDHVRLRDDADPKAMALDLIDRAERLSKVGE